MYCFRINQYRLHGMSYSRAKSTGRRDSKPFVKMYRENLDSPQYASLSSYGVKLLMDLYAQFKGSNNGDLSAAFTIMKPRGWRSKGTLSRAITELREKAWVELSRQGGRNKTSLYALTFLLVNECKGKLDIPETNIPSHEWKRAKLNPVPHIRTNLPQIRASGTIS